ncbi:Ribosomal protein L6 [Ascosphaera apis ARSEF 7405]|uniref:Ribosomal protein L6 n=1 Tax=Ascosphaera apis ARSEF 7405 TaxID=392613 RepID=A0A162I184_9EURO|nr:Ribosomal protein L6 [Ascosphaera apis ARSEF 7405]
MWRLWLSQAVLYNHPSTVKNRRCTLESAKAGRARGAEIPKQGVEVKGPLGTMSMTIPSFSTITFDEATRKVTFKVADSQVKQQKAMWGTIRAIFASNIRGVSEGHISILRLVGVGFRATVDDVAESSVTGLKPAFPGQKFINLKVGYAHPIELACPPGVEASTPQPTMILLQGVDKQKVKQFAAEIREWRRPEPYKGKGIFIDAETIKMKAKKIK